MNRRHFSIAVCIAGLLLSFAAVAQVPDNLNYQGVLRDSAGEPLNTSVDMVFRLFTADVAGDEIIVDRHLNINGQAVAVADGLFDVQLGTGEVLDGSGPGTYTSMSEVFRYHSALWLEVQIGSETLSPRTPVNSSGYAMNSKYLGGMASSEFLDAGSSTSTKQGKLILGSSSVDYGIQAEGPGAGGYFLDSAGTSYAYVANNNVGIVSHGNTSGGKFHDADQSGFADVAHGDNGIDAFGNYAGGYFKDADSTGYSFVGFGDSGIQSYGSLRGGYFKDLDSSGYAHLAYGDYGIQGFGNSSGGYFTDLNSSGYSYLGWGDYGVSAGGTSHGGYFHDSDSSGYARVGYGDYGLQAFGTTMGGYFADNAASGYAYVGYGNFGIYGVGSYAGGYFNDSDSSGWARVAHSTYKIYGSGTVSFTQNHPKDPSKTIVYHAPESSEVGVYTRGSARLENGSVRISLDETFQWVTNPDLGLTAHLTPRGPDADLYVASVSPTELVVEGSSDVEFDYMIWGLRIGFEELAPVQEKTDEAYIPSMKEHQDLYAAQPELRKFNALERTKNQKARFAGVEKSTLDLNASQALIASIGRFDPAVHELPGRANAPEDLPNGRDDGPSEIRPETPQPGGPGSQSSGVDVGGIAVAAPGAPAARIVATDEISEPDASESLDDAMWFDVSEPVSAGDVLTLDPVRPGSLIRAASMADGNVVGIAVAESVEQADGSLQVQLADSRYVSLQVDAGYGAIAPGDLLVASPTPGHAMRSLEAASAGTVLGKAIDSLDTGTGTIRVLLML